MADRVSVTAGAFQDSSASRDGRTDDDRQLFQLYGIRFHPNQPRATSHACHCVSTDRVRRSTYALPVVNCNHWTPLAQRVPKDLPK